MLAANLRSSQEAVSFLGRRESLENSQKVYKKSKQAQISKDFERKQPKVRDQEGCSGYRETPRDVRHVRYGYRQSTPDPRTGRTRQFDDATIRHRRNMQQAYELNPQIPQFQTRNMGERQRPEQAGIHTGSSMVNNPNPEN